MSDKVTSIETDPVDELECTQCGQAFDVSEWKLQRCQKRLANLSLDNDFDRAQVESFYNLQHLYLQICKPLVKELQTCSYNC